jgi:CRP-like cAMP-binding protein
MLQPLLDKLMLRSSLEAADQAAVIALPHLVRLLPARDYIVREDETPGYCCLLLSGYAYQHKIAGNGGRQIFSIHMRGDVVDLQNSLLHRADHNVEALTAVEVALIPVQAIRDIADAYPKVGQALWHDTLVDAAILREWAINTGRRDARTRIAHLLCEFALRLSFCGLGTLSYYELPMTQDQMADMLSLTKVHINRMLRLLTNMGLIEKNRKFIKILDLRNLAIIGDFDHNYLHMKDFEYSKRG